jgi:hypothetical protein
MAANSRSCKGLGLGHAENLRDRGAIPGRNSVAAYGRDGHKYLTPDLVEALIKAARQHRHWTAERAYPYP